MANTLLRPSEFADSLPQELATLNVNYVHYYETGFKKNHRSKMGDVSSLLLGLKQESMDQYSVHALLSISELSDQHRIWLLKKCKNISSYLLGQLWREPTLSPAMRSLLFARYGSRVVKGLYQDLSFKALSDASDLPGLAGHPEIFIDLFLVPVNSPYRYNMPFCYVVETKDITKPMVAAAHLTSLFKVPPSPKSNFYVNPPDRLEDSINHLRQLDSAYPWRKAELAILMTSSQRSLREIAIKIVSDHRLATSSLQP